MFRWQATIYKLKYYGLLQTLNIFSVALQTCLTSMTS